ncbi:GNAT family N-acetyltransferase [Shimia abyssi]|uniref:CelD/BcsL family acetyltransferase involved in cellulose biosynthesis n=1 Tax=Shimia abyssi TaxID=1662395 RepID=A0A2P8F9Q1_9RHOB|nr:GNAT family N-acetyltransferase [Shimia abyssi]PSL18456.1 CelD/BcsL family acetyltransferase involved in cellulose biosynthesis [Shimia abyssi]
MRCDIISVPDLDADSIEQWRQNQLQNPDLCSPFFSVGYAQAVAKHRSDVKVAVIEYSEQTKSFFAFHKLSRARGAPLGGQISDYQGIVGPTGAPIHTPSFLKSVGLASYDFNHALQTQPTFAQNAYWQSDSPRIDLRDGYENWYKGRAQETSALKTVARKKRKLIRELGELRFLAHDPDPDAWDIFLEWKRAALAEQNARFILDTPWLMDVAKTIRDTKTTDFAGMFSTLYAGDRLIAAHFGMRSHAALHWWMPSYDASLNRYSPGLVHLALCAEDADARGLSEVDLGRGTQRYKREFSNASRQLCEGSLERPLSIPGSARGIRKLTQKGLNRFGSNRSAELGKRAMTRALSQGRV